MDPEAFRLAPAAAILTTVGFIILAFILLYPVWKFINREEEISRKWTEEEIRKALEEDRSENKTNKTDDSDPS